MKQKEKLLLQLPLIIFATVLLCCTASNAQTVPQIAEKALAATVSLEMYDRNGTPLGRGSGFFVQHNLIATNYHVIEGAAQGTVKLVGKETQYTIEGFTTIDKANDLALLKVTVYGIKPLPLGNSDTVRIGETVYVAGNPLGLEGTVSDGIISSRRDSDTQERLQMTAPISPGSSGGPVLNGQGKVIGVSVSVYRGIEAQNLNFAIPSNYLKALLNRSGTVTPFSQQSQSISADTYYLRGNDKTRLEDYQGAIVDYTQAIRLKPDYAFAYVSRGYAKEQLGQYFAAITDYDTAIRLKPDYAYAYVSRGNVKVDLGQSSAAITDYDTAIRLKPDDAFAYVSRGYAKAQLGQSSAAITDYDAAIRLKPDYAYAYVSRGNVKVDLGQSSAAITDYDTAIRLKPDNANVYYYRGRAKADLGQHLVAISDFDMAIRLQPNDAGAYLSRGIAKANLGQHFDAIADYDMVIRLEPDDAYAYYNRGIAKADLGQHFDAIADYDAAIRLKSDYASAYGRRGIAKADLGQHSAAIADYDVVIRLNPNDALAYYNRGFAKGSLGRFWEGKQDLRTALKLAEKAGNDSLKIAIKEFLQKVDQ